MKEHCRQVLEELYTFLEGGELTAEQTLNMEEHLLDCAPCLEEAGVRIQVVEVTRIVARVKDSCHCPDGLKSRITHLIEEA